VSNHEIRKVLTATLVVAASVTVAYACATPLTPDDVKLTVKELNAVSSTALSGTAGAALSTLPSVVVKDNTGEPYPNIAVTFTASSGTQPTPATVTTNNNGIAAPTSWTMQTTTGTVTLTAATSAANGGLTRQFTVTVNAGPAASGSAFAGNNQSATAGSAVSTAPQVKVVDQFGNAVQNASVTFAVTGGGGTVNPTTAVLTDATGVAKPTSWTLGTTIGTNTLRATISGVATPVTFTASGVSGTAASIVINPACSCQAQTVIAGSAVPNAPSVLVRDANNNPVAGVIARFTVASGNGKLFASSSDATGGTTLDVTTDASGIATAYQWKTGSVGANSLSVNIPSVSAVTPFTITATGTVGPPASIAIVTETPSSNNQTAFISTDVGVAPGAVVKDANGNVVAGTSVTFTVASGGGTIKTSSGGSQVTSGTVTTDVNGVARLFSWTLGPAAGANTVTAGVTSNGSITPVTFTATGRIRQIVASIALNGGDNQTAQVMTAVTTSPSVKVLDINGAPVVGATVVFTSTGGGGQTAQGTAVTDVNGVATPGQWTLGRVAGQQTLTATLVYDNASSSGQFTGSTSSGTLTNAQVAGNPVVFSATAIAGPAAKLDAGTTYYVKNRVKFDAFVQVTDAYGNYVAQSGVTITASVSGTGATMYGTTSLTTGSGGYVYFDKLYVVGTVGTKTINFSSTFPTNSQPIELIGGYPAKIVVNGGDSQSATQLTTLTTNPSVKVTDADNNVVEFAEVRFSVTGGGGSVPDGVTYTDASGIASTQWTLGVQPGANSLTATVVSPQEGTDQEFDPSSTVTFNGSTSGSTLITPTISGNPVLFSATATERATVCNSSTYTLGSSGGGTLNKNTSCLRNVTGVYFPTDIYSLTTTGVTAFSLTMSSGTVTPRVVNLMWPPSTISYYNEGASPLTTYYFVKAGTYSFWATQSTATSGSYTLSSTTNPSLPSGCLYGIVTTGVSLAHNLDTFCSYTKNDATFSSSKRYIVALPAGTSVTITASSGAFDPYLELYTISGTSRTFFSSNDNGGGGSTASITFTPAVTRLFEIRVTNAGNVQSSGNFTLTIQ